MVVGTSMIAGTYWSVNSSLLLIRFFQDSTSSVSKNCISLLLRFAREPLAVPIAPSTHKGNPIKIREAYDLDFERYLVSMFLERYPEAVAK